MKVVHFIDYFQPGFGYQETFLAKEHARQGHDVYVVTSDRYGPSSNSISGIAMQPGNCAAGFFVEQGIKVWRLKTLIGIPYTPWLSGLESRIRELRPDIVIVHNLATLSAYRLARLRRSGNFKLIFDDHMTPDNSLSRMRILYPFFRLAFSPRIQKSADALVAILPETRMFMHRKYGIPLERISIIPLGADDELFRFEASARQEIRQQLSIPDGDVVFIYTGKLIPTKMLPVLLGAMEKLAKIHDRVRLLVVGDGPIACVNDLQNQASAKGLEDKIIWHQAVPNQQLYRFYSAADVAVWPAGASISMREAMACALPVIVGENAKVLELLDYHNGLSYPEGDVNALAERLADLLDAPLREEMGRRGRKLVEDRFSWRVIAPMFLDPALLRPA